MTTFVWEKDGYGNKWLESDHLYSSLSEAQYASLCGDGAYAVIDHETDRIIVVVADGVDRGLLPSLFAARGIDYENACPVPGPIRPEGEQIFAEIVEGVKGNVPRPGGPGFAI